MELHALILAAHSYVLLHMYMYVHMKLTCS